MLPFSYTIRNLLKYRVTTILTLLGFALVVFVFCGSLMLTAGMHKTLVDTGSDDNFIITRKAAQVEVQSLVYYSQARIISAQPEIAVDEDGAPMITNEIYVLILLNKRQGNGEANVVARGVTPKSLELRDNVSLVEGRMFKEGASEVIVGSEAAKRYSGCAIGEKLRFGSREWTVVGIFDARRSAFDSEVWLDVTQASDAFRRPVYSSLTLRLNDASQYRSFKERLENDPRLPIDVSREADFYARQSQATTMFLDITSYMISLVFCLGAIVGAMITMYASVASRTKEIGTLRALGFSRFSILTSFLVESMMIALAGGVLGILAALLLQLRRISTMNWDTFSDISFNFYMAPWILGVAVVFAVVMGLVGGFLPAVRAARLKIIDSLRAA